MLFLAPALTRQAQSFLSLGCGLLLVGDCALARSFAGTRIGMSALAPDRQVAAMAEPTIGTDFNQPLDMHGDIFAEVTFHIAFILNDLADAVDLIFIQVLNLLHLLDVGGGKDAARARIADAVDISQRYLHVLLPGKINA